jgi:hypothetical protein
MDEEARDILDDMIQKNILKPLREFIQVVGQRIIEYEDFAR